MAITITGMTVTAIGIEWVKVNLLNSQINIQCLEKNDRAYIMLMNTDTPPTEGTKGFLIPYETPVNYTIDEAVGEKYVYIRGNSFNTEIVLF